MLCCSSCALPKPFPLFEYSKKTLTIPTTHGSTYCEIYFPNHLAYSQLTSLPHDSTEILLMVHGLGGSLRHWSESDIPAVLAQNNAIVVCFDLYTHGKSEILSNDKTPHDMSVFTSQVYDIIHSPDLFIHKYSRLHLLGFSFGGWTILNYLITYHKLPSKPCCNTNHCINKIIFQSPWNGNLPSFIRGLLHIPGALRASRPSDMAYINDWKALKHILLYADREKSFKQCCAEFVELIENHDELIQSTIGTRNASKSSPQVPSSPVSTPVMTNGKSHPTVITGPYGADGSSTLQNNSTLISDSLITIENNLLQNIELHHTASEILFLSGQSESFFTGIATALRKTILKSQKEKIDQLNGVDSTKAKKNKKNKGNYDELDRRFPQRICRRADHVTFVKETNLSVGQFYRDTLCEFLLPKFHVEITDEQNVNPQHSK